MGAMIEYRSNHASEVQLAEHLSICDRDFVPCLSGRIGIGAYAAKIARNAARFEAWNGGTLIGLVAAYCNDTTNRIAYITSVSVRNGWIGKGIATQLLSRCVEHAKASGMRQVNLQVANANAQAIDLYERNGFVVVDRHAEILDMTLYFRKKGEHEQ